MELEQHEVTKTRYALKLIVQEMKKDLNSKRNNLPVDHLATAENELKNMEAFYQKVEAEFQTHAVPISPITCYPNVIS